MKIRKIFGNLFYPLSIDAPRLVRGVQKILARSVDPADKPRGDDVGSKAGFEV